MIEEAELLHRGTRRRSGDESRQYRAGRISVNGDNYLVYCEQNGSGIYVGSTEFGDERMPDYRRIDPEEHLQAELPVDSASLREVAGRHLGGFNTSAEATGAAAD